MNSFYDSIKQGLIEAVEYEKGKLPNVKVRKVSISPINSYSQCQIREIRANLGMTQVSFAHALGVSPKTIEAWESGTNKPSGIASRMLELIERDNTLLERYAIVDRKESMTV
ncbi:MAG: helix-turn-helix domain-containing protein [Defluviitaleaceae bacterium]|nr:helix-turn-helix domain-containing protein [Defluviitaleaceae bacterium]